MKFQQRITLESNLKEIDEQKQYLHGSNSSRTISGDNIQTIFNEYMFNIYGTSTYKKLIL